MTPDKSYYLHTAVKMAIIWIPNFLIIFFVKDLYSLIFNILRFLKNNQDPRIVPIWDQSCRYVDTERVCLHSLFTDRTVCWLIQYDQLITLYSWHVPLKNQIPFRHRLWIANNFICIYTCLHYNRDGQETFIFLNLVNVWPVPNK